MYSLSMSHTTTGTSSDTIHYHPLQPGRCLNHVLIAAERFNLKLFKYVYDNYAHTQTGTIIGFFIEILLQELNILPTVGT